MKKRFLAAVLAATMTLAIAGCGKKTSVKLCEYKNIPLQAATEEEVRSEIDASVETAFLTSEEIDGPAILGDTVNINYCGKKDGVAFEGGTDDSEMGTDLILGSNRFIAGFEDGLVGAMKGETRDLNLTFPEQYRAEGETGSELNGAAVVFTVTVNSITRELLPELTDELVFEKTGFASVAEFEQYIRDQVNSNKYQTQIQDYLTANCTVTNLPEDELEEMTQSTLSYAEQVISYYGSMGAPEELVLQYFFGVENRQALEEFCRQTATDSLNYTYILKEIADKEDITLTEEEFRTQGEAYCVYYGYSSLDEFESLNKETNPNAMDELRETVLMDKVMQFLVDNGEKF